MGFVKENPGDFIISDIHTELPFKVLVGFPQVIQHIFRSIHQIAFHLIGFDLFLMDVIVFQKAVVSFFEQIIHRYLQKIVDFYDCTQYSHLSYHFSMEI